MGRDRGAPHGRGKIEINTGATAREVVLDEIEHYQRLIAASTGATRTEYSIIADCLRRGLAASRGFS